MGWRRELMEWSVAGLAGGRGAAPPAPVAPGSIFVLRNNDIGDLLAITPLFEALKRRFPAAAVAAGIGDWNRDVLRGNPFVDEVLPVNAPWHNKVVRPQGGWPAARYLVGSPEVREIRRRRFAVGIDVLGSPWGTLLLRRCGIPFRLGVRGYAGGAGGVHLAVDYNPAEHVGRAALRFAELLGATDLPPVRPQLFLGAPSERKDYIAMAPGGGFPDKCWPVESFVALASLLAGCRIVVIGGVADRDAGAAICRAVPGAENRAGQLSLAEVFRVLAEARLVVCNSSMAMHAAAAFRVPACVVLGRHYVSAAAHAAQWAYPETVVLGPEPGGRGVWTAAEVADRVQAGGWR